jgi:transcriptional regulator with XRE-family HTH domain
VTRDPAYEMLLAEEQLILAAQMMIIRAMKDASITQKELASRLNVSHSYVSQMLGNSARNLTLRTVARVFHVLGLHTQIKTTRIEQ